MKKYKVITAQIFAGGIVISRTVFETDTKEKAKEYIKTAPEMWPDANYMVIEGRESEE